MRRNKIITLIIDYTILIIVALITLVPLVYCIMSSFKTNMEIFINPGNMFPKEFTLDNYKAVFNGSSSINVPRMMWNSTYYTLFSVAVSMVISSVCGYVFARGNFKGKKLIFGIFTALMFVNMGTITIYPKFKILGLVHLNRSLFGLMALKFFGIPIVNMYLVKGYIDSIPRDLDEMARIEGCNYFTIFVRIIAPLLVPILATISILGFQASWNEYLMPSIFTMGIPEQTPLVAGIVALKTSGDAASAWSVMFAGTVIAILPVLVAYCVANKFFVQGLTAGAVKG